MMVKSPFSLLAYKALIVLLSGALWSTAFAQSGDNAYYAIEKRLTHKEISQTYHLALPAPCAQS